MYHSQFFSILIVFQAYFAIGSNEVNKLYTFSAKDIHNEEVSFDAFEGKVIIIVNVASICGFTDISYKELQQIYKDLGSDDHFVVLGFPCNQFGKQEPDPEETIEKFVKHHYNVEVDGVGEKLILFGNIWQKKLGLNQSGIFFQIPY